MKYLFVRWKHPNPEDPTLLYSELNEDRWEVRKVEIYADGRLGYADNDKELKKTRLGLEPVPALSEIAKNPEFEPEEITREEFERIWTKAVETGA